MKLKTGLLLCLSIFFFVGCLHKVPQNSEIVFKLSPNSGQDAMTAVKRLIADLQHREQQRPIRIVFPKGRYDIYQDSAFVRTYYISNHDQINPRKVGFALENLKNVTLDGQGSELIFHGRMIPFSIIDSENITLKNFSIDFKVPAIRQLTVLKVAPATDEMLVEIYPKGHYKIKEGKLVFTGANYEVHPNNGMVFMPNKRMAYRRADIAFNPKSVEEVAPNRFLIKGWNQNKVSQPGNRFVLRDYMRPGAGVFVSESKNIKLENVAVHYADGMGLIAQRTENITLDGFKVALRGPEDPRYFTTQADATHFVMCKGKIISKNGLYEAMADDAINIHGIYLRITQRVDDHTVRARYMHHQAWGFPWGDVGDEVHFINSETMENVGEKYKITTIKAVGAPTAFGAKEFDITLNKALPAGISPQGKFAIENLTWTPEVEFTHNLVRNNRARGALFSSPRKTLVEYNTFDHTHGAAILIAGDANGWFESGPVKDIIIRKNKFINALTANYQFTNAIISIYPEIPDLKDQKQYYHSNIVIEDNVFDTFDTPILYAKSTDGLIFKDNKVLHNQDYKPFHWNHHQFLFEHVNHVEIKDNYFEAGFLPTEDIKITLSPKDALSVSGNTTSK